MKYAIIENEEYARINLKRILQAIRKDAECVFESETVKDSKDFFASGDRVDLVFMDIELDDGNCFEIFPSMNPDVPVVFTTAYDEYAIRAFKVNSVDYILKPVGEEDIEAAVRKFEQRQDTTIDYSRLASEIARQRHDRILISSGSGYSFVRTADVAWIEAADKYISLVLNDGSVKVTDLTSLGEALRFLDPMCFYQVSRSVVASIDSIQKVSKYFKGRLRVELRAGKEERTETVTAARKDDFLDWLGNSSK